MAALFQVLFINLILSGDNAVVVGLAAAGVDPKIRQKVIFMGISAAVVLRIGFALVAVRLLDVIGLTLAGGVLLLWICWKMYREIRSGGQAVDASGAAVRSKSFGQAMMQILIADLSMSLDNVLAVAGAAEGHSAVLVIGLLISVILMAAAATLIAKLLERHHWLAWVGLLVILYVAIEMIWRGSHEVACSGLVPSLCFGP